MVLSATCIWQAKKYFWFSYLEFLSETLNQHRIVLQPIQSCPSNVTISLTSLLHTTGILSSKVLSTQEPGFVRDATDSVTVHGLRHTWLERNYEIHRPYTHWHCLRADLNFKAIRVLTSDSQYADCVTDLVDLPAVK